MSEIAIQAALTDTILTILSPAIALVVLVVLIIVAVVVGGRGR